MQIVAVAVMIAANTGSDIGILPRNVTLAWQGYQLAMRAAGDAGIGKLITIAPLQAAVVADTRACLTGS
jgi:hypothetical protein